MRPTTIHITCVVLKYGSISQRVPERFIFGVGSNYLLNLNTALRVPAACIVRGSVYKISVRLDLPSTFEPIITIGPGADVAPFRGFVRETVPMRLQTGQISLFYGCRRDEEDFCYSDEWPEYGRELKGKFRTLIVLFL
ncbi:hypothetical protein PENSPDRAFT_686921 [Peniophora sp. CONT]|nr:hypothetical protein PENSPDRAFT_686921 [Peniophora sp. CONT]